MPAASPPESHDLLLSSKQLLPLIHLLVVVYSADLEFSFSHFQLFSTHLEACVEAERVFKTVITIAIVPRNEKVCKIVTTHYLEIGLFVPEYHDK